MAAVRAEVSGNHSDFMSVCEWMRLDKICLVSPHESHIKETWVGVKIVTGLKVGRCHKGRVLIMHVEVLSSISGTICSPKHNWVQPPSSEPGIEHRKKNMTDLEKLDSRTYY